MTYWGCLRALRHERHHRHRVARVLAERFCDLDRSLQVSPFVGAGGKLPGDLLVLPVLDRDLLRDFAAWELTRQASQPLTMVHRPAISADTGAGGIDGARRAIAPVAEGCVRGRDVAEGVLQSEDLEIHRVGCRREQLRIQAEARAQLGAADAHAVERGIVLDDASRRPPAARRYGREQHGEMLVQRGGAQRVQIETRVGDLAREEPTGSTSSSRRRA